MAFTPAFEDFVKGRIEDYKELGAKQCVALNAELEKFASLAGDLPAAEWYVLDIVTTNLSYIGFGMNAEKVADIAGIFPVFFIVVAALVALTSMTRMVEEDRMQIGTFKALGYTNGRIMSKYMNLLLYRRASWGCVVGVLFGFSLLPTIFWQAYKIMYLSAAALARVFPLVRRHHARRGAGGHHAGHLLCGTLVAQRKAFPTHAAQGAQSGQTHFSRTRRFFLESSEI